jgi:N-acetylneuraminate synthase
MVQGIRDAEAALGTIRKGPAEPEWKNRPAARKSLVATQPIAEGDSFTPENLGVKRPGDGVSPMRYWQYLDRSASKSYQAGERIQ